MKKIFSASFKRLKKSKFMIVLIVAVILALFVATIVSLANDTGGAAPDSAHDELYWEYLKEEKAGLEEALKNPDLNSDEIHDFKMQLAKTEYFLQTKTSASDYYNDSGADGAACWMQVYFLIGAVCVVIAAIVVTVWFFPGSKSGVHRTEFLTGCSRKALWNGKNAASALASTGVAALFVVAMLVSAFTAPQGLRFLVEDDLTTSVYSVSVYTQWAIQSLGLVVLAVVASAVASVTVSLSGDTSVGVAVPIILVLVFTLGMFFSFNMFPESGADNFTSTFIPFLGLMVLSFRYGVTGAYVVAIAIHIVIASVCYGVSFAVFERKSL